MAGFLGLDELFEGDHFDRVASILCVRYLRFKLSFRDLVEMMTASAPGVMWRPPRRSSQGERQGCPPRTITWMDTRRRTARCAR